MLVNSMKGPIKTVFCGIETVSCVTGFTVDHLYELVESGHYLWVWNMARHTDANRELRFWCREINNPSTVLNLSLNAAMDAFIPKRTRVAGQQDGLYAWELRNLLRLSKSTVFGLREELGATSIERDLFIPRANLEDFFRRRWVGNVVIPNCAFQPDAIPRPTKKLCL
jgi:hypothetical protein